MFYKCPICGNVIYILKGNIAPILCCNTKMEGLVANTVDAAFEKHVPVYEVSGDDMVVKVGSVMHPMEDVHYITFIAQVYDNTINIKKLNPKDDATCAFKYIKGSKIYEYCNLHGLWECEVK